MLKMQLRTQVIFLILDAGKNSFKGKASVEILQDNPDK